MTRPLFSLRLYYAFNCYMSATGFIRYWFEENMMKGITLVRLYAERLRTPLKNGASSKLVHHELQRLLLNPSYAAWS